MNSFIFILVPEVFGVGTSRAVRLLANVALHRRREGVAAYDLLHS